MKRKIKYSFQFLFRLDDDKVSKSKGVLVSILVFAILIFLSLGAVSLMTMKSIATPMASSENKANIEMSDK